MWKTTVALQHVRDRLCMLCIERLTYLHRILLPIDGMFGPRPSISAPVEVELDSLVGGRQPSAWDGADMRNCNLNWWTHTPKIKSSNDSLKDQVTFRCLTESPLTWVAVVLDCACEDLLVVLELERSQTLIFQSLPGDDVDGWLLSSSTGAVGMGPLLWCWNKCTSWTDCFPLISGFRLMVALRSYCALWYRQLI